VTGARVTRRLPKPEEFDRQVDEAMAETPDPISPCLGCRHETRCAAENLCCDAAALFRRGFPEVRYRFAPRAPSRTIAEVLEELARRPKRKAPPQRVALEAEEW
jgi:hypothetical protein